MVRAVREGAEEISEKEGQNAEMKSKGREEDSSFEDLKKVALQEIMTAVIRMMNVVSRYFQFKLHDMYVRGLRLNYNIDTKIEDNRMQLILTVEVPEDILELYARRFMRPLTMAARAWRTAKRVDKYLYARGFEEEEDLGVELESGGSGGEGGGGAGSGGGDTGGGAPQGARGA